MSTSGQVNTIIRSSMEKEKKYLTINQLAKACSTSRSTILRMEEYKVLTPSYINPETGYRYYDISCVLRVIHNLTLQELGITYTDIRELSCDDYDKLLGRLRSQLEVLEYHIRSISLQMGLYEHLSVCDFYFPETYCVTERMRNITDVSLVRPRIDEMVERIVYEGYKINRKVQPFVVVDYEKMQSNNYENIGYDYEICIPVLYDKEKKNLKYFDKIDAISVVLNGGSKDIKQAFMTISEEIKKQKLMPVRYARVIAEINSYPGMEIPKEHWVVRVCLEKKREDE